MLRAARFLAAVLACSALLGPASGLAQGKPAATANPASHWTIDSDADTLKAPAEGGDAAAQYVLGMKLWLGRGLPRDVNAAIVWLTRSAAQDYALAESALGVVYEDGDGVHQDAGKAAFYYARAAQGGEALGQYRLGLAYLNGKGLPQDDAAAARWFRAAAEQGMPDAENNLGYLYAMGRGVPRDIGVAIGWYEKAAQAGNADAKLNLASLRAEAAAAAASSGQAKPGQAYRIELKDIVAGLEGRPLDNGTLTADFGKPGAVEIKAEPSDDGRLEEVRIAFTAASGRSWLSYKIFANLSTALEAFDNYGRTPAPEGAYRHAFTVGLMSNNRPLTLRCLDSRDAKGALDEHEVSCSYFERDAPLVYLGGTVARYKDANYPPDEVWKRAGEIAAAGYWHAHRVLQLGGGGRPGG